MKLSDWSAVDRWLEEIKNLRTNYASSDLKTAFTIKEDMNYIRALAKFDVNDMVGAKEYIELASPVQSVDSCDPFAHTRLRASEVLVLHAALSRADKTYLYSLLTRSSYHT